MAAAIIGITLFCVSGVKAEDSWRYVREKNWALKPVEKLGRGIANVAFSPMELLMKTHDIDDDEGHIAALTKGVLTGATFTVARVVVGVVDIATFPFPLPDCPEDEMDAGWGYGPILRPAWVVDAGHNWGEFFFNENSLVRADY